MGAGSWGHKLLLEKDIPPALTAFRVKGRSQSGAPSPVRGQQRCAELTPPAQMSSWTRVPEQWSPAAHLLVQLRSFRQHPRLFETRAPESTLWGTCCLGPFQDVPAPSGAVRALLGRLSVSSPNARSGL